MFATGFVEVDGGRIGYQTEGDGHPLVLIHGRFADRRMWDDQIASFARQFQVIRYDARGHGRSSPPERPFSHAEDLRRLLIHLGIAKAHIVGLSMGGGIAIDFTLAHPGMVSALVAAEPGLGGFKYSSQTTDLVNLIYMTSQKEGRARAIEVFLEQPLLVTAQSHPVALSKIRSQLEENFNGDIVRMQLERGLDPPAAGRLAEIRVPTLSLLGDRSWTDARRVHELLAAKVPGIRTAVIENSGHMMNLEQPERFNHAVLGFLRAS